MTRKEALAELIEKVGKGKAPKYTPDYELALYPIKGMWAAYKAMDAYEGSLDAAKALHEAVLPGWWWKVIHPDPSYVQVGMPGIGVYAAQSEGPSRAWLLAILRALYAQEPDT